MGLAVRKNGKLQLQMQEDEDVGLEGRHQFMAMK